MYCLLLWGLTMFINRVPVFNVRCKMNYVETLVLINIVDTEFLGRNVKLMVLVTSITGYRGYKQIDGMLFI